MSRGPGLSAPPSPFRPARDLVLACLACYCLPEPTRLADREVAAYKRSLETGALAPA